jgi:hypothetical protein
LTLTTTERAGKKGNSAELAGLSVGVSIRCDNLVENGSKSHTQTNVDAMNDKQDPKVAIFGKHLQTFKEWWSISGLSITWWRFRLCWHEDQWYKCNASEDGDNNELNQASKGAY